MREALAVDSSSLDSLHRQFYRAFVENAFGDYQGSVSDVLSLLEFHGAELSDSDKINLLGIQESNYYNTCRYGHAAAADDALLKGFSATLNAQEKKITRNSFTLWSSLSGVAPQRVEGEGSDTLSWTRDALGLMEIPVRCGDSVFQMVFDTRAGMSTLSVSMARSMGLKLLPVSYDLGSGATGLLFKSGLAVADSLQLGHILMRHVVFQVVSDSLLYFAPVHFGIRGIFGFAAMRALGQVEIRKAGQMIFSQGEEGPTPGNLALDGYDPVIRLGVLGDTLNFYFDSGATTSDLYSLFFKRFGRKILREGKLKNMELGGAGGVIRQDLWVLPELKLICGKKTGLLHQVDIHTSPVTNEADKFYGNIGQDFISQFNRVTINFKNLYVSVK